MSWGFGFNTSVSTPVVIFLSMLAGMLAAWGQIETGRSLTAIAALPLGIMTYRWLRAYWLATRLYEASKRLGRNWIEPDLKDGALVWQRQFGVNVQIVVWRAPMSDEQVDEAVMCGGWPFGDDSDDNDEAEAG